MEAQDYLRLTGTVEHIVYQKEESGFTVLELASADELITVVGEMPGVAEGEELVLTGNYVAHPTFGSQFRVSVYERQLPATAGAIYKYLAAGAIKGIGPALARRIVDRFGENTLDVMEKDPGQLCQVKGVSQRKAGEIAQEFKRIFGVRAVMLFLAKYQIHSSICVRVWKKWAAEAVDVIRENPYVLCRVDIGLDFGQADGIARSMDIAPDDPRRIAAGLQFVLSHNLGNGHTCLPAETLIQVAGTLLETDRAALELGLEALAKENELIVCACGGRDFVFLPELYAAETYIAGRMALILSSYPDLGQAYDRQIDALQEQLGITYESRQRRAITMALNNGVFILTGGPGTGKTTIINAIIELFEQRGDKVMLAAPTGRAAKRMSELTGRQSKTIHRLLEVDFRDGAGTVFKRDERNTLPADVIVVDEMSMVDTLLFQSLLRAMKLGCRLVMVGDTDQLPSVGPGNVLKDLIEADVIPTVHLQEIFRQAAQSLIVTNAHAIVRGEQPDLSCRDKDFFYLAGGSYQAVTETLLDMVQRRLPRQYGFSSMTDIQVLCPSRMGQLGTMELNRRLQERLNPPAPDKPEVQVFANLFRLGDKVMQIKNNYDIIWKKDDEENGVGVFNGDIGEIIFIDKSIGRVKIRYDDRVADYSVDMMSELELAYAVTVHKSQGSEFPCVILSLDSPNRKLYYRNLLYTAVTRAKQLLLIMGNPRAVPSMVENNRKTLRYTNLAGFLSEQTQA